MSKRMILYALAGVAGLALATGDTAAAPQKARHFGTRTTTHATAARRATFQSRVTHKATVQRQTATHQRFHKAAVTHQSTPTHQTHFGTLHTHTPSKSSIPTTPNKTSTPTKVVLQGKFKNGPKHVGPVLAKKFPIIKISNNKIVPIWKSGPKKIWVGGHWKVFVPFTALSVVLVGGHYYWPDAYLTVGRPYCEGVTPDGCRLNWQLVNFTDGGNAWQCVQYCPRPDAPPPAQSASLVPPPLPPGGACEVTIHSEPNLAGQDATTGEEQPALRQTGWQDAIASIEVKSGVWDFFSDENFTGNNMRLRPGTYQNLGPDWTRKINSFRA
ncbi:MAG TPA: beta/gamma crystallin-related protein [Xanthobacteraceae bacterium]|nr:beta/gamma crystallin-related protein [Xanthobacteraceae bacterium]